MSRSKKNRKEDLKRLNAVQADMAARSEGPQKKKWSVHDIKPIQPMTETQTDFFHAYLQDRNIVAYGSAGTGKSFLAMFLALRDVVDRDMPQQKVRIVRSAVASREVGHLPGDLDEKMAVFEAPYKDICTELFRRPSTYEDMKEAGIIEFTSTSYVRGSTWDDTIVIVDEAQNLTWHELNSVMTRIGENSRIILTGDLLQNDLNHRRSDISGMARLIKTAERMSEFATMMFTTNDIVRSEFVKSWIIAAEATEEEFRSK